MVVESKMRLGGRVARRLLSTCSNSSFTVTVLTILLKNLNIGSHVLSKSFAQTPHLERSFREINKYKFMWNESSKYYFINQLSISRVLYSYQGGRPYKHVIVTLDPNKFAEKKQKRLHINLPHIRPRISLLKHSSLVKVPYLDYDRTVEQEERISYPPDTKAFLYYSLSPGKPRIAGELRFRVTSSDDPASFESGSDLLRRNGLLWSRPLYSLSKHYPPLYEKLREDQFIPDDLDEALATIPKNSIQYSRNNVLYTFNDAFTVNFGARSQNFFIITEQGLERLIFYRLFFDRRRMYNVPPYTGAIPSLLY